MKSKAMRFLTLLLCVLLAGGLTAAHAELVTVGILLTGTIPEADGSVRTVTPEGRFRIYQNGEEAGVIAAGRETLTLNSLERIRIEPLPQSFAPEWDMRPANMTVELTGSGVQMIPITVTLKGEETETPVPEWTPEPAPEEIPEATAEPAPEATPESAGPGAGELLIESTPEPVVPAIPAQTPAAQADGTVPTPTLPPFTPAEVTPEPAVGQFPEGAGTGSLRIQVFFDKNVNGNQGDYEYGIRDIPIYLLNEAEEAVAYTVTDADGFALFTNVPAGRYRTRTLLPDEWYFTAFGGENSLILNAYDVSPAGRQTSGVLEIAEGAESAQGIGIHNKASSMSGFCWMEQTVDGLYTADEPRVPGAIIRMKHRDEDISYETVADAEGNWTIDHLHPGYYIMSCEGPEGLMLTRYTQARGRRSYLTSDHPRRSVEINPDKPITDANIGFNWAAQIVGRCYLDANYNGLYDEGELPLPGVKLSVKFMYDSAEASSAVSGEDGTYVLDGMRGNLYWIQVILPEGGSVYTRTAPEDPLGNLFEPRADRRDQSIKNYTLADAERRVLNIGAIYPATVSGIVYYDDNFSAVPDGTERKVPGFTVTIRDAEGNIAATARTDNSGRYELANLTPGDYTLDVTATPGYAFTRSGEGNVILNRTGGAGYSEPFRVALGENVTGKDIGMILPGTVKGAVFADLNDNGIRDAGENGLAGAEVRLMSETEEEAFQAEIGADGDFLFDAVMPGRYYLEYTLPEETVFARLVPGGNAISGEDETGKTEIFNFATGQVLEAPVCGALTLGRIEGQAYQDHDGNGRKENEETLAGMTIQLIPSRDELEAVTAVTGEDGRYVLEGIRPDVYRLQVTCPEGYVLSRTDYLTLPLKAGKENQGVSLEVSMGATWLNQETGAVIPAALSGQLWMDENDNGLFDEGEKTPAGYQFRITDESTGAIFDTPVTDEQGRFSAAGMIPGQFTVSLPLDDRTLATRAGDSVFTSGGGVLTLSGIRLQENERREGLLAGIVRYTSVSGHAWIDRGEAMEDLGGVRISMKDPDGREIAGTITDGSGNYSLDRLMPGSFYLEVNAPEGCVIIEPGDPRLAGGLRSVVEHPSNRLGTTEVLELRMDEDITGMDIGCVLPGRLGDYCWVDLNGDGLQAGDEPGLPNMRIELLRDGKVIAETETDQYGFYRFVDLYPAEYVLKAYAPAEVKPTKHRTDIPLITSVTEEGEESTAFSVPVTVESNRSQYNADLGFVCRQEGVLPAGCGEGETQDWIPKY